MLLRKRTARLGAGLLGSGLRTEGEARELDDVRLPALRYPESHRLYVLEREAGGRHGGRDLHHVSSLLRVHSPHLAERPAVVVASEPLDDSPDWRLLEVGELVHVAADLTVTSAVVVDHPPAELIHLDHPTAQPAER